MKDERGKMKVHASEQESSLLELLQRQRVRALLATTEPLGLQRSATKSPKPNFNEVKGERRNRDPSSLRSVGMTSTRLSLLCTLCPVICTLFSVGFAQVALARHSKSKLFLCTRLLATFSVLCTLLSPLPAL